MKEFRYLSVIAALIVLLLLTMTSCADRVDSPENFYFDDHTQTLHWDKVPGALGYSVLINGVEKSTRTNSYQLEYLEPGTYTVQVKALGDGDVLEDSLYFEYSYTREKESGLTYKLINNNTAYELTGVGTAEGDVVMESYYRNKPVVSIAPKALANNEQITSFTINEFVTTIPDKAFNNCKALVSITIPENVTSMGMNVFQSCRQLASVEFPDSLVQIGEYAFAYCGALTTVKLGGQTTAIGNFAFTDCKALAVVEMPDTVIDIGNYAFSNCEAITDMELSAGLERIGENAFYGCKSLTALELGQKLVSIGNSAFAYCEGITAVSIPNSLVTIGQKAFANCTQLATITLQQDNQLQSIGQEFILGTAYLETAPTDELVYVGNWLVASKDPEIAMDRDLDSYIRPGTVGIADKALANCTGFTGVNLQGVKYIGNDSFAGCTKLMDVRLDKSALVIGRRAFSGCKLLTNLFIASSSLREIGANAFLLCERLKTVDLPDTVETIGPGAFLESGLPMGMSGVIYADNWAVGVISTGVSDVTIREGTVGIANYTFNKCENIGSVTFPESLRTIGKGAFYMCTSIKIAEFNEGLISIGDYAFYACTESGFGKSANLVLPSTLESIGRGAFYQTRVTGLEIPGSCKYIGDYAFFNCPGLGTIAILGVDDAGILITEPRNLIIREGVEYIGQRAFAACYGLKQVTIPNSVTYLGQRAFYQCTSLEEVKIGMGVTAIEECTFYECEALTRVELPNGITSIGDYAFRSCKKLESIRLGDHVTSIGTAAFAGCEMIPVLRLPATLQRVGEFAFYGLKSILSLTVSSGLEELGEHAMYSNSNLTLYVEHAGGAHQWQAYWNSSFRPVIWGCTLSQDKTYLVSFVKDADSVENGDALSGISAPYREGYVFLGWSTTEGGLVDYELGELLQVPDGTTVYAVWGNG